MDIINFNLLPVWNVLRNAEIIRSGMKQCNRARVGSEDLTSDLVHGFGDLTGIHILGARFYCIHPLI